jgi:formate hydrogenlyase subunit 3/multisubunit Na+/H+ antiporter MnhD subunit
MWIIFLSIYLFLSHLWTSWLYNEGGLKHEQFCDNETGDMFLKALAAMTFPLFIIVIAVAAGVVALIAWLEKTYSKLRARILIYHMNKESERFLKKHKKKYL